MSLILHISDPHLGKTAADWQLDYDDKVGAGRGAGNTGISHLKRTVHALGVDLDGRERRLDAVVISGDLTKGNRPDGYQDFEALLAELGPARPDPDRIVVVPGNHDVERGLKAGDPEKLTGFLDAVRPKYRSPLIKGIDYNDDERSLDPGSRGDPRPILLLDDAVLVAFSSADYCGIREERSKTEWDALLASYLPEKKSNKAKEARKLAASELKGLRTRDIPQVPFRQLEALGDHLDALDVGPDAEADKRLRIAVLHHPIGVAGARQEIKPFEVITNLAEVRGFLRDRGFHLVLHGHKHESYAGWEWLVPPDDQLSAIPRRVLVLGSPGDFKLGQTACRLIEVSPEDSKPVAGAPRVRLTDVKAVRPGQPLHPKMDDPCQSLAQPFMQSTDLQTPWVVKARTADAVYQQLRDLPMDKDVRRPVISVVEEAESAWRPPQNYGRDGRVPDLEDLVDWWQLPRPEAVRTFSGSAFNHGERLYPGSEDAIERAVDALPSSKAIALLVDPKETGQLGNHTREFPAFTAVQLQPRALGGGHALDILGIYRKQDLDLWWPVNMAELAKILEKAIKLARDRDKLEGPIEPGRLIAFAAFGVHDNVLPQMAGTALDRAVDLRPEWLYELAHLAAHPAPATAQEWDVALGDIGERDGPGLLVPAIGLERLLDALQIHTELVDSSTQFAQLVSATKELERLSRKAENALTGHSSRPSTLDNWADQLRESAGAVLDALAALLAQAGITPPAAP
jgi:predicted MPP superfamily phosphohydrolase